MEQYGEDVFSRTQYIQDLIQQEVNVLRHAFVSVQNAAPCDRLGQYFEFLELALNYIIVLGLMKNDHPGMYSSNLELAIVAYNQAPKKKSFELFV